MKTEPTSGASDDLNIQSMDLTKMKVVSHWGPRKVEITSQNGKKTTILMGKLIESLGKHISTISPKGAKNKL